MSLDLPEELIARQPPESQAIIRILLKRIDELEARLGLTPENSSLPPSTQHPHAKPIAKKRRSKRKQGGQPGHKKQERSLIPPEDCEEVIPLKPSGCRRCGEKLSGTDADPWRHQVWELPEIKPLVTEYQRHRLTCPCCGETTCAELPSGVPTGQAGPRLVAFVAILMAHYRQSKRRTALFLETILGQPCSASWTIKLQKQATAALRPSYDELTTSLAEQPQLGADETPMKESTTKSWLGTFVATSFTVFAIRPTRAATILTELLSDFSGVITCDRAKMYWQCGRLQWCWAHLKRDFQALIDSKDRQVQRLGHDLMRPTRKLFRQWSHCRDGNLTRTGMKRLLKPIRQEIEGLLLRGACSGNPDLVGMCNELYNHRDWLWTFLEQEDVELTNNRRERALRHAVIWRKLSFGTQSASGSRFVETLLTTIETCRQQDRNVFDFVTNAVQAKLEGKSAPSLLPGA